MKILLIIVVCVALILGVIGIVIHQKTRLPDDHGDLIGSIKYQVKKLFKNQQEHGVVVGVYKDGRAQSVSFGVMKRDMPDKPNENTVFQIGSITKVFTAYLLQQLHEQGVVQKEATLKDVLGQSYPLTDSVADISLLQLATHTSGFPRIPESLAKQAEAEAGDADLLDDPYSYLKPEDMFAYLATANDVKPAGNFDYSNYGMGLLGHILEFVTGESYEYLLQTHLFKPLAMENTGTVMSPSVERHLAQGYNAKGDEAGIWHMAVLAGAGAVNSNSEDMLKFIQASLEAGTDANKHFEHMRKPLFKGKTGLGWMQAGFIERLFGISDYVWHNGMVGGYASYIAMSADQRAGVVVLTSRAIDATMLGMIITRHVKTQSWAQPIN